MANIDRIDRKILIALSQDAGQSYAALAAQVGLSAPAVHERVKKLRASGTLMSVQARINAQKVGKSLLAFVHIESSGWGNSPELMALAELPELEEIHSVTGDSGMVLKVRVVDSQALEGLLARIYQIESVRSTHSYVALSTYLERGVQADISPDLHLKNNDD